jgi:hypothetical protein
MRPEDITFYRMGTKNNIDYDCTIMIILQIFEKHQNMHQHPQMIADNSAGTNGLI